MSRVVVIPARLESTRLPNKLILDLQGKSVIERVYNQCMKVKNAKVYIATDSNKIKEVCEEFTKNIILTKTTHTSGTDRIAEAITKINCEYVINVQGDEPFISPDLINQLFEVLEEDKNTKMVSAKERIENIEDFKDPNVVKVITDYNDDAIYFSRSPIPYLSNTQEDFSKYNLFKHVGVYGFTKKFLLEYTSVKDSFLEKTEKLEQLRAIEGGHKIRIIETKAKSIGIDTIEDYNKALKLINNDF